MSEHGEVNQQLLLCLKDTVEVEAWHCLGNVAALKDKRLRRYDCFNISTQINSTFYIMYLA